ncbi:diacylglycerol/lipid kinase family protein [Aurantiacibacter sp. MUD61]|uniref:diacylglycerol/lipid kinase family protein n=1 Tax=Aurantiacibacter sp. MUD61 TaxID=3009083 RepID=UPI0022F0E914|nr:diacylglycerol kinase family protein [Aurantiacibacter sp. MUD61]
MVDRQRIWLINNEASGSNDAAALEACENSCRECSLDIAQRSTFPAQELPSPDMLDAADIGLAVVYAGDGTINAALEHLAGWQGAVLVLPGGTMNLLYHRLFAELSVEDALRAASTGTARRVRPSVVKSACGTAYAGLLAGPGTTWNVVREAMRNASPIEMAQGVQEAFAETLQGERIRCTSPEFGTREGYPLILLSPAGEAIKADAYHADNAAEFIDQLFALIRRDFRAGPHDRIGEADRLTLETVDGNGFGVLLDGEPCDVDGPTEFTLAYAKVDLLATDYDG